MALPSRLGACYECMSLNEGELGTLYGVVTFPSVTISRTRMGAGIQECDVVFTKDKQLVCRHDQCDLHTTTNIVNIPELNAKCTTPFQPAEDGKKATAKRCTSDITLAEFKTLCGKMDGANASATTPADYLKGHAGLAHRPLRQPFTLELKTPLVPMPFGGNGSDYTQAKYAQQMIDEFKAAHQARARVAAVFSAEPQFGKQAVYLDENGETAETFPQAVAALSTYAQAGVKIMAPPVAVPRDGRQERQDRPLRSLERSGWLGDATHGGYYYAPIANVTNNDGDVFNLLHVLAQDVGVMGVFSDWSATVTYYANWLLWAVLNTAYFQRDQN
ncbi:putative glycerophosphoryl diester phosphodiesterase [Diplogelasinospora grovesii]|uniref:glycerophosphodiester phosphodiesterase n=1 Tax=Diplogelasinospora grovesii TaxID=303347 RepID=A0AAN6S0G7_9PEZI|nr:putative glycerophosphoryl diester phosphodiesterase [Diplogelasinospora grovesii]